MRLKLAHPLWIHLPALAVLIILLVYLINSLPLPAEAPVHFGFNGEPDAFGSPWLFLGITIGFAVFFIALSIFIDELWARQEKKKSFNWFSLLDEITIGWMVGMSLGYLVFLRNGAVSFTFPWNYGLAVAGGAVLLAVITELLRPYRSYPGKMVAWEAPDLEKELARRIKDDTSFVYWESQNPFYITLLTTLLPLVFFVSAVLVWFDEGWVWGTCVYIAISVLISVILIGFCFGGQRTAVTRQDLTVRWGVIGLRVLYLKTAEMAAVELHEFAPLRDFGGYGIRFGGGMKAYYLRGNHGVKISMINGKKYLIGSDHPERLLTVVWVITGQS